MGRAFGACRFRALNRRLPSAGFMASFRSLAAVLLRIGDPLADPQLHSCHSTLGKQADKRTVRAQGEIRRHIPWNFL